MIKKIFYNLWQSTLFDFYADMEKYRFYLMKETYEEAPLMIPSKPINMGEQCYVLHDEVRPKSGAWIPGPSHILNPIDIICKKIYRWIEIHHPEYDDRAVTTLEITPTKFNFRISGVTGIFSIKRSSIECL
jgi:hypothetical protein